MVSLGIILHRFYSPYKKVMWWYHGTVTAKLWYFDYWDYYIVFYMVLHDTSKYTIIHVQNTMALPSCQNNHNWLKKKKQVVIDFAFNLVGQCREDRKSSGRERGIWDRERSPS